MLNRKDFLKTSLLGVLPLSCGSKGRTDAFKGTYPVVVGTWSVMRAAEVAWEILKDGGYALDAVEAGARAQEADPNDMTVGYGGRPDRNGVVTLDACIMNEKGNAGSVAFLQDIMHPVTVARKVMEETPHVMLVGEGARQFAIEQGMATVDLLTPKAKAAYEKWLETSEYEVKVNIEAENHDTIGLLALDSKGRVCGACSTSGAAWKIHGRVGDSPIIGAGLFIDPEIGGAVATGLGEEVIKTAGTTIAVEMMRQGHPPEEACRIAIERVISRAEMPANEFQVGILALSKEGAFGGYGIQKGFSITVINEEQKEVIPAAYSV